MKPRLKTPPGNTSKLFCSRASRKRMLIFVASEISLSEISRSSRSLFSSSPKDAILQRLRKLGVKPKEIPITQGDRQAKANLGSRPRMCQVYAFGAAVRYKSENAPDACELRCHPVCRLVGGLVTGWMLHRCRCWISSFIAILHLRRNLPPKIRWHGSSLLLFCALSERLSELLSPGPLFLEVIDAFCAPALPEPEVSIEPGHGWGVCPSARAVFLRRAGPVHPALPVQGVPPDVLLQHLSLIHISEPTRLLSIS